ncbi:hypothetical protein [Bradyrhizobium sp. UFLA03-84]|uniref:hypothetical protein n=1 Tax=Bradyrhizobium sp. UFLA03-84 TaxID=418599 RepID=UPI001FDA61C2|nr:hypothetical protein [Bradyrhizobium sp. UFLA03-84]
MLRQTVMALSSRLAALSEECSTLATERDAAIAHRDAAIQENDKLLVILSQYKRAIFGARSKHWISDSCLSTPSAHRRLVPPPTTM